MLELDLPDPEQDDISTMEFLARLEEAWTVCDKFDLQTEIWRGRILKAVRDREKRGGEGRGAGFLQWLREREISKTRAYGLIQLAESAEQMLGEGVLEPSSVNQFSKRAFMETSLAEPEVQLIREEDIFLFFEAERVEFDLGHWLVVLGRADVDVVSLFGGAT